MSYKETSKYEQFLYVVIQPALLDSSSSLSKTETQHCALDFQYFSPCRNF